jgi:hypothetical protein
MTARLTQITANFAFSSGQLVNLTSLKMNYDHLLLTTSMAMALLS